MPKLLPSSRFMPLFMVLCALMMFAGAVWVVRSHSASERYKECALLAASNPAGALEKAKVWRIKSPDFPLARHCEALALYGMKDYVGAAAELEALAKDPVKQNPHLSVELLLQAAAARKAGGDPLMATQDLDYALTLEPNNAAIKALAAELSKESE
jgi:hypothetical protein